MPNETQTTKTKWIRIDEIKVPMNRRPQSNLSYLVESIKVCGMLNPITVDTENNLIAGRNRLASAVILKWSKVPVRIHCVDTIISELMMIDENLGRKYLSKLERSENHARRKELLESLGRVTKRGGDRKSEKIKHQKLQSDPKRSFADEMLDSTGQSPSSISQDVRIANQIIQEARDNIRTTDVADRQNDLLTLSKMDRKSQLKASALVREKGLKTLGEALKLLKPEPVVIEAPAFTKRLTELEGCGVQLEIIKELASYLTDNAYSGRFILRGYKADLLDQIDTLIAKSKSSKIRLEKMKKAFVAARELKIKAKVKMKGVAK